MELANEYLQLSEKWLDNSLVSGAVVIFFILFGGFLAPDLPHSLVKVFAHPLIKILFVLAILFLRKYSVTASILLTIIFILLVQAVTKFSVERIAQKIQHDMEQAYRATQNAQDTQNAQSAQSTQSEAQQAVGQFLNPSDPLPANADDIYVHVGNVDSLAKEIQELNPVNPVNSPNKYGAFGTH